jgi:F-type H+-transporting ATPase subunit a
MDLHISVKPETLWSLGPLDITNSFLTMLLVMAFLLIVGILVARRATLVPTHGQAIFEMATEFQLGLVEGTAGKRVGRRIFPLIGGLFIFIIVANYSGLLPGVGTIGLEEEHAVEDEAHALVADADVPAGDGVVLAQEEEHETVLVPFLRPPSADLNMTLAMAVVVFFTVQVAGIIAHGVGGRIKHMADPWWIFPIEAVSEVSRIISLSFRLFGNVFAGEVLLAVMVAFGAATFFILTPVTTLFILFEVLIGFIQALVFAILTLIYISLAVAGGHGDEEHAH